MSTDHGAPSQASGWQGLSDDAAAEALATVGPNSLPAPPTRSLARRVLASSRDPLVLVLLAAAALTLLTRDLTDAAVIGLVLVANTVVAVRQEVGADRALAALSALASPECRVVRGGATRRIAVSDVVPGDILLLAEGDLVPADAVVVEAASLTVDESTLTGESVPVPKSAAGGRLGRPPDSDEKLLAGTAVVRGRAVALVTATGRGSMLGEIAALLEGPHLATPLQRRMRRLSAIIATSVLALCAVVLALGLARGQDPELMVLTAVSLAVAAVPESLPAVVTVTLSLAARRMARRSAIVRNLAAVETLGSVTLLATDKTGTLTQAKMSVAQWWAAPTVAIERLHLAAVLCNDAHAPADAGSPASGDPTEVALLLAAGQGERRLAQGFQRIAEAPFDSALQRMTTVHLAPDGDAVVTCKGAPEAVLRPEVLAVEPRALAEGLRRSAELSGAGLRVLAIAARRSSSDVPVEPVPSGLRLLGLVAIEDPPRPSATATMKACREAGIRVVLVTGDHARTAVAVARQVSLATAPTRSLDLSAASLDAEPDLAVDVIARARPADKLHAVRIWQGQGHIVAMTGDGVNDGPALRQADIGVAMGRRGTEVARQAADLVIADDELETLVAAVEEGRRVYANIRRFLLYGLSGGLAEVLVMLVGPFLGAAIPLLPGQILWVNLLTHSIAGTALGTEPVEAGSMQRAPRSPHEGVLGGGLWWRITVLSGLIATAGAIGWWAAGPAAQQSALMFVLATTMLGVALGARARSGARPATQRRAGWWRRPQNPGLLVAVLVCQLLLIAAVELPGLRGLLQTQSPGAAGYLAGAACGAAALLATRALRLR